MDLRAFLIAELDVYSLSYAIVRPMTIDPS